MEPYQQQVLLICHAIVFYDDRETHNQAVNVTDERSNRQLGLVDSERELGPSLVI